MITGKDMPQQLTAPRFLMVGGFLGAGKTTTLLQLAHRFQQQGKKVGIVTNDQAEGLVDTELVEELDIPVREIAGGCFCCKSESLVEALERLSDGGQPDVFLAEPVGSCTDLVATVNLPLQSIYHSGYEISPYAVLVDPYRVMDVLGLRTRTGFTADVNYIYRKQLEEAEIIVVNKMDVVADDLLARIQDTLKAEYPEAQIIAVSSRTGEGMDDLFERLSSNFSVVNSTIDIDYDRYGKGEALLGWYNGKYSVSSASAFDGNDLILKLSALIRDRLNEREIEIAHFKACLSGTFADGNGRKEGRLAAASLVSHDSPVELRRTLNGPLTEGGLTVNLRAEAAPDQLAEIVKEAIRDLGGDPEAVLIREEFFRPGQPTPTHRVALA